MTRTFKFVSLTLLCLLAACGRESQADSVSAGDVMAEGAIATPAAQMVQSALSRANQIRAQYGLPALTYSATITRAAQGHANDMLGRNYFEHASLDGRSPFDRMRQSGTSFHAAAENIARGQRSAEQVFTSWLNSPGHRKNLLNPKYRRHGLGWANGYWVHNFAD